MTLPALLLILATAIPPDPNQAVLTHLTQSPKDTEFQKSLGTRMGKVPIRPQFVPSGFMLTNISVMNGTATLGWQAGTPLFQINGASSLASGWSSVGNTLLGHTSTFPVGQNHFWRVEGSLLAPFTASSNSQPRLNWSNPDLEMSDSIASPIRVYTRSTAPPNPDDPADFTGWTLAQTISNAAATSTPDGTTPPVWYKLDMTTVNGHRIPHQEPSLSGQAAGSVLFAKRFGGTATDFGTDIVLDAAGNYITCGTYSATVDFGGHGTPSEILTSPGGQNSFVAKYSPSGVLAWVKGFGNASGSSIKRICLDPSGNILAVINSQVGMVFKLNAANGNTLWSKGPNLNSIGVPPWTSGACIASDSSGNAWVSGSFAATPDPGIGPAVDFGDGHLLRSNAGHQNAFLACYSSASGTCLSAAAYGDLTGGITRGDWVGVDTSHLHSPTDIIYLAGSAEGGSISLDGSTYLTPFGKGGYVAYLGKFAADGTYSGFGNIVARNAGLADGSGGTLSSGSLDNAGNPILAGIYEKHWTIGDSPDRFSGPHTIWIAKFNWNDFSRIWDNEAVVLGSAALSLGRIVADSNNNTILAGGFGSQLQIGLQNPTYIFAAFDGNNETDCFVIKYSASGSLSWAQRYGGTLGDNATGACVDSANNIVLAAGVDANVNGTFPSFGSFTPPGFGGLDVLILRLSP